jgi:hypothetical protein
MKKVIQDPKEIILYELRTQENWEWKWERLARYWGMGFEFVDILAQIIIVGISTILLTDKVPRLLEPWLIGIVALAGTLNLVLNRFSMIHRFQQRQQVHDETARTYKIIRIDLEMGLISLEDARDKFDKLYKLPTETIIRSTP